MIEDPIAFIRANTVLAHGSHVPEIALRLADDAFALWSRTEDAFDEMGLPPPFWAFAWAGGQALARYILDHPETVAGRRVADIAAGSGLVAIAAMKAGAAHARALDVEPLCAHAIALNAAANGVAVDVSIGDPIGAPLDADIVLIGDLFYDRDISARLIDWIESLERAGVRVLIGDPGRTYLPKDRIEAIAEYHVPTPRTLEDSEIKCAKVWRLKGTAQ